jgi:hypothetical protein
VAGLCQIPAGPTDLIASDVHFEHQAAAEFDREDRA